MEVSINITDKEINRKKIKTSKKGKNPKLYMKILFSIVFSLVLGVGIYFLYKTYKATQGFGFTFSPTQLIEKRTNPELAKDSSNTYTNVMLIGIDTRETGNLLNTDTIMVASFNHQTKDLVMVSIPRDFSAQVDPNVVRFNKINSSYSINERRKEGSGLPILQSIVEEILGIEIQYYAMIDLKGFVNLIDAVGGVYVNVENSFTDYMYPKGKGYQTVSFKAGPQQMDGDTALKYARSRHSRHNNEGTDYARARRQQRLINGLKDTLSNSETLLNPTKLSAILSSIQNNVKTSSFDVNDIKAGIDLMKELKETPSTSYSFVLDPLAGNRSLVTSSSETYTIKPTAGNGKYGDINKYIQLVLKNPVLYSENPSIYVYNTGLGQQESNQKVEKIKKEFKYLNIRYMGTKYNDKENIYVFSNKEGSFSSSVEILSNYLTTDNTTKPDYVTTKLNGEDISIFLGKTSLTEDN